MRVAIVYEIPDEIDPSTVDPHDVADALTAITDLGGILVEGQRIRPVFAGAEWCDGDEVATVRDGKPRKYIRNEDL